MAQNIVAHVGQRPELPRRQRRVAVLFEAIPDGPLEAIMHADIDDLDAFAAHILHLLEDHAPGLAERIDPSRFRPTGPLDVFRGADHADRSPSVAARSTPTITRWRSVTRGLSTTRSPARAPTSARHVPPGSPS